MTTAPSSSPQSRRLRARSFSGESRTDYDLPALELPDPSQTDRVSEGSDDDRGHRRHFKR